MTTEKLLSVFADYEDLLSALGFEPARNTTEKNNFIAMVPHLYWMCQEVPSLVAAGRIEKAMRWLGFVQGYFHACGIYTLDEIKNHNRPDKEKTA